MSRDLHKTGLPACRSLHCFSGGSRIQLPNPRYRCPIPIASAPDTARYSANRQREWGYTHRTFPISSCTSMARSRRHSQSREALPIAGPKFRSMVSHCVKPRAALVPCMRLMKNGIPWSSGPMEGRGLPHLQGPEIELFRNALASGKSATGRVSHFTRNRKSLYGSAGGGMGLIARSLLHVITRVLFAASGEARNGIRPSRGCTPEDPSLFRYASFRIIPFR